MDIIFNTFRLLGLNLVLGVLTDPMSVLNGLGRKVDVREIGSQKLLAGQWLYRYSEGGRALYVMVDNNNPGAREDADEEDCGGEEPLYYSDDGTRVSPYYVMKDIVSRVGRDDEKACFLMLTSAVITNKDVMMDDWRYDQPYWDAETIVVYDDYVLSALPETNAPQVVDGVSGF